MVVCVLTGQICCMPALKINGIGCGVAPGEEISAGEFQKPGNGRLAAKCFLGEEIIQKGDLDRASVFWLRTWLISP